MTIRELIAFWATGIALTPSRGRWEQPCPEVVLGSRRTPVLTCNGNLDFSKIISYGPHGWDFGYFKGDLTNSIIRRPARPPQGGFARRRARFPTCTVGNALRVFSAHSCKTDTFVFFLPVRQQTPTGCPFSYLSSSLSAGATGIIIKIPRIFN